MKTISIIIARGGSKGIPKKNIMDFCGKPLVNWTIEQSFKCNSIDEVYVSTDSTEIADIAHKAGANIIIRPDYLATDTTTSEDVILHAIDKIDCDLVVFPQVTSPLRFSDDFTKAIDIFNRKTLYSLMSVCQLEDYCIWNEKGSVSYDYKNRGRRQDRKSLYLENGSFYIFKPEGIKKYRNRLHEKIGMYEMNFWQSYEIDSLQDIPICEYFMMKNILKKKVSYE